MKNIIRILSTFILSSVVIILLVKIFGSFRHPPYIASKIESINWLEVKSEIPSCLLIAAFCTVLIEIGIYYLFKKMK